MNDWKKMISVANIFSDSTKMLEVLQVALSNNENNEAVKIASTTTIPIIVLKAFACEMYLKAYLSKEGSSSIPKTHDLHLLFRNLSKQGKSRINFKLLSKLQQSNKEYKSDDLEKDLIGVSNAFEEWRYFYEKSNHINIQFLNMFYETLRELSLSPHAAIK